MLERITVLAIFISCMSVRAEPASQPSLAEQLPTIFATIHKLDWLTVRPDDVDKLVPFKLTRRHLHAERDSTAPTSACTGSLYMLSENGLSIEFEEEIREQLCVWRLESVAFEAEMSNSTAMIVGGRAVFLLKPGGKPSGDSDTSEYQWRSTDSRTRYDFYWSVKAKAANPTPATPANLKLILRHDSVSPSEVDDLPFEKGFFCSPK